ncbi:hypothetical protein KL930_005410 [Ogataea haglerorum]|uniref:I/LWEQ domain-containing protein n=1 Tax=Ogataea haglerorum TaxID=1937702 RepID=A0AAN6HY03_9ASCO|nr:uncharacterized protein KL911_005400 [Ogataea haglerorum]KAG7691297.1 hypothetical protein KL915_005393 [Ogataea haglerorum]KAG7702109.1 hypothetical protein KL914_005394 [Ogataea haglerorum]KAG7702110.1 hypothetical protein KL950_005400 [Ogataea haglerorum]KAG7712911.1 hypothetical protein KL949_005396 [Ogataea haglerorum]KAG7712916.1 hypothetical protein KL913_005408 [Ogataea haglerorum]
MESKLKSVEETHSRNLASVFSQHSKEIEEIKAHASELKEGELDKTAQQEVQMLQQAMDDTMQEFAEQQQAIEKEAEVRVHRLIDTLLKVSIDRLREFVFNLESPVYSNTDIPTAEYLGTMLEKVSHLSTQFSTTMTDYIADDMRGENESGLIKTLIELSDSIGNLFSNVKAILRDRKDDIQEILVEGSKDLAHMVELFFESMLSNHLMKLELHERTDRVITGNINVQEVLQSLMQVVEVFRDPGMKTSVSSDELGSILDKELANTQAAVEKAAGLLDSMSTRHKLEVQEDGSLEVNEAIISCASAIINAVRLLLKACIDAQEEIVSREKGSMSRALFYKKNNRWTEGLISASKQVAYATGILIKMADGVLAGTNTSEELIVASNEVASATAQLVSSSRVKSDLMSQSHLNLEEASKKVTSSCKMLVTKVRSLLLTDESPKTVDYSQLTAHENRTAELEQQVEILKLESALSHARKRLGEIRKFSYRDEGS